MLDNPHYQAISEFYGRRRALRSQIPLVSHIDDGLRILDALGSSIEAKEAFCIHPMLQDDDSLRDSLKPDSVFRKWALDSHVVVLAMEYRSVANAYLSQHFRSSEDHIMLSALPDVNDLLIADKVQNRKDFEIHHRNTHENREILAQYFDNWLRRLAVSEVRYTELVSIVPTDKSAD